MIEFLYVFSTFNAGLKITLFARNMILQNIQSANSLFQFVLLLSVEREGFFLEK